MFQAASLLMKVMTSSLCPPFHINEQIQLLNLHYNCKPKYQVIYPENDTAILHLTIYSYQLQSLSFQHNKNVGYTVYQLLTFLDYVTLLGLCNYASTLQGLLIVTTRCSDHKAHVL